MNAHLSTPVKSRQGSALLILMGFIAVITITLASLMVWTSSEAILVSRRGGLIDSLYGAEAAVRRSMSQVRVLFNTLSNNNTYATGSYVAATSAQLLALTTTNSPSTVPVLNNAYTYTGVTVAYTTGTSTNRYVTSVVANNDPSLANWAGLTASRATVRCSATATSKTNRYAVPATVSQDFVVAFLPVFQFAAFFNTDMEIFNGATMDINGRLHVNGTLYYAPAALLTVDSTLTTSGDIERGMKLWNSSMPTTLPSTAANYSYYLNQTPASWTTSQRDVLVQQLYKNDPQNWVSTPPTGSWSSYGTASFKAKNATTGSMVDFKTSSSPLTYFDSESTGWAGGATTRWGGGVKSTSQGMAALPPPPSTSVMQSATTDPASPYFNPVNPYHIMIDPPILDAGGNSTEPTSIQSAKMAYGTSLLIQRDSNTNVIYRIRGTDGAFHQVNNLRNANNIVPSATTTLLDQREYLQNGGVKMSVTEFDVNQFYGGGVANAGATDANGVWQNSSNAPITTDASGASFTPVPFDGTIYIYDSGYSATYKPAVRIKNGASIYDKDSATGKNDGLSIVTTNPAYVQGNFNADGSKATGPEMGNETVAPAMIAADVISILSTSWSSSKDNPSGSASNYFTRSGTADTEVNAAILAGVNASAQSAVSGSFSNTTGGLNNFPRFLEYWTSAFKYSGSLVSLWYGQQSTSTFRDAGTTFGVFSAPTRLWAFDTDFLDPNKLPRLTPLVRQFVTANWNNQ